MEKISSRLSKEVPLPRGHIDVLQDMLAANLRIFGTKSGPEKLYDLQFKISLHRKYAKFVKKGFIGNDDISKIFKDEPRATSLQKMQYLVEGYSLDRLKKCCMSIDREIGRVSEIVRSTVAFAQIAKANQLTHNGRSRERELAFAYFIENHHNESKSTVEKMYYKYADVFSIILSMDQHKCKMIEIWRSDFDILTLDRITASAYIFQKKLRRMHPQLFATENFGVIGKGRYISRVVSPPPTLKVIYPAAISDSALIESAEIYLRYNEDDAKFFQRMLKKRD